MPRPTTRRTSRFSPVERGKAEGYRSGLEVVVDDWLKARGIDGQYEQHKIKYLKPAKESTYTPDFKLPNGIIVETKGRFLTADRQKHLLIQAQHPELDIRFVFGGNRKVPSAQPISKQSKTTYAMWCLKNGFQFADNLIPESWLTEKVH